jgi:hypothetical protein
MSRQVRHPAGDRPRRRAVRAAALTVRTLAVAATVALTVAAAGCAKPSDAAGPAAGDPGRVPSLLRSTDLRLPLDDFLPSLADRARLARAGRVLLSRCMHGLGFDYVAPEPAPTAGPRTWNERRYGLADPAQAVRGYWPDSRAAAARAGAAGLRGGSVPTAAEGDAVTGRGAPVVDGRRVPPGGCAGAAQRRLTAHDPPGADQYLAQRLTSDSFFGSQQDARVRATTRGWADCMTAAGYPYAGPLDPPKDQRFSAAVTPLEIATASADVRCKRRTNLVGVWFSVESTMQRTVIGANRAALDLARAAFQAELAVAEEVGS